MRALVIGCGYVGKPLAEGLARQGHEVFGASRLSIDFAAPVTHIACDITRARDVAGLPVEFDWVVNTVSSSKGGAWDYRAVFLKGTKHLLEHLKFGKYVFT